MNNVSTAVLDDEEAVEELERRRRHCEQIDRGDVVLVVPQERNPALHLIGLSWTARQVTRHRHFRDATFPGSIFELLEKILLERHKCSALSRFNLELDNLRPVIYLVGRQGWYPAVTGPGVELVETGSQQGLQLIELYLQPQAEVDSSRLLITLGTAGVLAELLIVIVHPSLTLFGIREQSAPPSPT